MKVSRIILTAALAALINGPQAFAHIGWSGTRDFNSLTYYVTETSSDRNVGGAFGWADATDSTGGDSHRNVFYRFVLSETADVSVSVARVNRTIAPSGAGTQTGAHNYFLPAFSLYRIATGTMPLSTHDGAPLSKDYLTTTYGTAGVAEPFSDDNSNFIWNPGEAFTDANGNGVWDSAGLDNSGREGSLDALGDFKIYSDGTAVVPNALGDFDYIGNIADGTSANFGSAGGINGDGLADGTVGRAFEDLIAGEYFIAVGGAVYNDQLNYNNSGEYGSINTFLTYGVSVSVTAIPEPASAATLAGFGALGLVALRRRRRA